MRIVCKCHHGYASQVDGLCRYCRAKEYSCADKKKVGAKDGMTLDQKDRLEKRKLPRIEPKSTWPDSNYINKFLTDRET
jgi:hypothetical protein